jgi:hypothetical protein
VQHRRATVAATRQPSGGLPLRGTVRGLTRKKCSGG